MVQATRLMSLGNAQRWFWLIAVSPKSLELDSALANDVQTESGDWKSLDLNLRNGGSVTPLSNFLLSKTLTIRTARFGNEKVCQNCDLVYTLRAFCLISTHDKGLFLGFRTAISKAAHFGRAFR